MKLYKDDIELFLMIVVLKYNIIVNFRKSELNAKEDSNNTIIICELDFKG